MYHYLYKTTNLINGKFYIGIRSTKSEKDNYYLGSGTALKQAVQKYGRKSFRREVLSYFNTRDELIEEEKRIVNIETINDPLCYNMRIGGIGGSHGRVISDETRKKMSDKAKQRPPELREYLRKCNLGKKIVKEGRKVISVTMPPRPVEVYG